MTTTTNVKQVKLNIMTQSQYNTATKDPNELYMITDAQIDFNDLANKPTVDQTYNASSTNAQSGTAVAGALSTVLPSQTSQSGKYLTTNGTTASWANIPTEVEWATYGTTTLQQVKDWYDAGKAIFVARDNVLYTLCSVNSVGAVFTASIDIGSGANISLVGINSDNSWYYTTRQSQKQIPAGTSGQIVTYTGTAGVVGSATINDIVPTQASQSGKFLTTNGTAVSWANVPEELPSQSGNNGKFLTTNGTAVSWADTPSELPSQSGQSGKVLTTNGTAVSWTNFPTVDQTYSGTSTNAQSGVAVKSAIDAAISSVYKPAGSVEFANLPALSSSIEGYVYNVSDAFTTTSDFVEGAGKSYPAGTNVVCINTATSGTAVYKWDVLAGFVDLSGYQTLIDSTHKLSSDLVDDTNKTNKFVTTTDITNWNGKVDANAAITGATHTKITYDSKGLVTAGADLTASDIPSITLSKISDVTASASEVNVLDGITATTTELNYVDGVTSSIQTQLNNKVTGNTAITGATKCKITYDSKGLVTAGADLSASDIPDISATYQTKLSSTNTLNADYISDGTTNKTVTATEKSTWSGKQDELVSGTNIKTINSTSLLGSGDISITGLPSQTSQSGKYLTTNGTTASWADVPTEIPTQTGNSGKFLTTNGTAVSWATVDALPSQTSQSGKFLTTNGTSASWASIPEELPSQTGQSGKYLTTNGTAVSWADAPTEIPSQTGNNGKFLTTNGTAVSWGEIAEYTANEVETLWDSVS